MPGRGKKHQAAWLEESLDFKHARLKIWEMLIRKQGPYGVKTFTWKGIAISPMNDIILVIINPQTRRYIRAPVVIDHILESANARAYL